MNGSRHRGENAAEQLLARAPRREVAQDDDEFIAAEARGGVARAQCLCHAIGHHHQQGVADIVAMLIVDGLEAIQVEIPERQRPRLLVRLGHGRFQALGEQRAVGQIG